MSTDDVIRDFTDLVVWQRAIELGEQVYVVSAKFPRDERFGLTSQIRRAAVSIASNIAEGHARRGKEFKSFLSIAKGSTAEVESQILFAVRLRYVAQADIARIRELASEIHRMTAAIIQKLSSPDP